MGYIAISGQETHRLEVSRGEHEFRVRLDECEFKLDVLRLEPGSYSFLIEGRSYEVDLLEIAGALMVLVDGQPFQVEIRHDWNAAKRKAARRPVGPAGIETLTAPLPGKVKRILVAVGQPVQPGDGVAVLEAMKMENELKASCCGTVTAVRVEEGQSVNGGDVLVVIE